MILLVDNYDSFAFNLDRYLRRLGADVMVLRNDDRDLMLAAAKSQAIVVSPGPCGPEQAGQCVGLVQQYSGVKPILGICLGHQAIVHALGGRIIRAPKPVHGQARAMRLARSPLLTGIAQGTPFARYHSLLADWSGLPQCLSVIAVCQASDSDLMDSTDSAGGTRVEQFLYDASLVDQPLVMAVQHRSQPTYGVQFHPESILSQAGYQLLANFLTIAGLKPRQPLPQSDMALCDRSPADRSAVIDYFAESHQEIQSDGDNIPAVLPSSGSWSI